MLVVAGGERTRLDTGSVALALARRLGATGAKALLVDADVTAANLARRCGQALGASFSPAVRGLPTLIAAREPLRADALGAHCYSLGTGPAALWVLFAPESAAGGRVAAAWLADRLAELRELDRTRRVVVSAPAWQQRDALWPLVRNASVLLHHQRITGEKAAEALELWLASVGLAPTPQRSPLLLAEDDVPVSDDQLQMITGMRVIARLPFLADEKILRMRLRGRDAAFGASLDKIVAALSDGSAGSVTPLPSSRLALALAAPAEDDTQPRRRRRRDVSA